MNWAWVLLGISAVAMLVGYAHPISRPYVVKYAWLALVPLGMLLGVALYGPRRRAAPPVGDGGYSAGEASKAAVRALADNALARSAEADAELARRRLAAQLKAHDAEMALALFDEQLENARAIDDAGTRRAAIVALVEGTK